MANEGNAETNDTQSAVVKVSQAFSKLLKKRSLLMMIFPRWI